MKYFIYSFIFMLLSTKAAAQDQAISGNEKLNIWPVMHASLVLTWDKKVVYVDPANNADLYKELPPPNIILVTDIHRDHLDLKVLKEVNTKNAIIVAPQAVADMLPTNLKGKIVVLDNGEQTRQLGISISAIPMYNLPESDSSHHPKGRGNGYIVNMDGKNIYISGDTEDIPEMRALKNIDIAFLCMNLPYTMDILQAASAVLEFKPGIVYPYHYRGQDIKAFKKLVNDKNKRIEVRLRNWYPQ